MTVDVVIEEPLWECAGLEHLAERGVAATLAHLGLEPNDWDVVVMGWVEGAPPRWLVRG